MPIPKLLEGRLTLPVIGAPMFIVSGPELVIAQCKAGIVGSFPALNARPKEQLDAWLTRIKQELSSYAAENPAAKVAPFAVNQIAHHSNDRLLHDVEVCVRHEVPIIITSLRAPANLVKAVHAYGGIVLHDVINVRHAEKALEEGVDGLILVCSGAGGHAGQLSPFALLGEVRRLYSGTVCLAGAITSGGDVLAAQSMGADLAYVGTRFIATEEANAKPDYKQMVIDAAAKDIVYSSLFTGVNGNYLKPSVAAAGFDPDNLPGADKSIMNFSSTGNMAAKAWRDIWSAGQGVGRITDAPRAEELIQRMRAEYRAAHALMLEKAGAFRA